jgi:hypothetical protein
MGVHPDGGNGHGCGGRQGSAARRTSGLGVGRRLVRRGATPGRAARLFIGWSG